MADLVTFAEVVRCLPQLLDSGRPKPRTSRRTTIPFSCSPVRIDGDSAALCDSFRHGRFRSGTRRQDRSQNRKLGAPASGFPRLACSARLSRLLAVNRRMSAGGGRPSEAEGGPSSPASGHPQSCEQGDASNPPAGAATLPPSSTLPSIQVPPSWLHGRMVLIVLPT